MAVSITSNGGGPTANVSIAENTTAVTTVVATSDDPPVVYSLDGSFDFALFQINSSSGVLAFIAPPDYENPTDDDHDNIYVVSVIAADDVTNAAGQIISVTVTNAAEGGTSAGAKHHSLNTGIGISL